MARIVHMDQLVPPDIDFDMGNGTVYRVSGSISMASMLRLGQLEGALHRRQAELDALVTDDASDAEYDGASTRMLATLTDLNAEVLAVLRGHHPDLDECPFTPQQVGIFIAAMRGQLDEIVGPDPTPPPPTTTGTGTKRAAKQP